MSTSNPITAQDLFERVRRGVALESDDAGIRIVARYRPAGGPGSKVFPPTYAKPQSGPLPEDFPYVTELRFDGEGNARKVVVLDATQSQSNRVEEALLDAADEGALAFPYLNLECEAGGERVRITSLTAPHRNPDAYFRDSQTADGTPFDDSEVGQALRAAGPRDATAYFKYVPTDLFLGFWDSHRGGRGTRLARAYTSEMIGWNPQIGRRSATRVDPNNIEKAPIAFPEKQPGEYTVLEEGEKPGKGLKPGLPSNVGHGSVPASSIANGGVSIDVAERVAYLSFAGLARLRFPAPDGKVTVERNAAARAVLALLALAGDRWAFHRPSVFLRSGCELILESETIGFVGRGAQVDDVEVDRAVVVAAIDLALNAARDAGLEWQTEPLQLAPKQRLVDLLAATFAQLDTPGEE